MPTDVTNHPQIPVWLSPIGRDDNRPAVRAWIAHVDAGRIGRPAPASREVIDRREATAAQFAGYARGRR